MNKKFIVNGFEINNFRKPYIIAEACINHDGNIETAKKMVVIAKKSGADCIKFQIHNLKNEMLKETPKSNNFTESLWDTLEKTNITESKCNMENSDEDLMNGGAFSIENNTYKNI